MKDARAAEVVKNLAANKKNVSEAELQEIVNSNIHWSVVNSSYRTSLSEFNTLMKDPSMSLDKKILTLDLLANQQKQNFATQFGRFYNKPEIKEASDFLSKQIDGVVTSLKNDSTGKNFADTDSPIEGGGDGDDIQEEGMDSVENTPNNDGMNSVERGEDEYADADADEEDLEESLANGADDTFESDINFMINGITGGLNGKKRNVAGNGQSTIPAVAIAHESRLGNPMRESTDLLKDWKKLAGM
jgi:hypothetical protein